VKLDIGLITKLKLSDAIISRCNLVINAALENSDAPKHEMLLGGIPYVPGVIDI